MKVFNVYNSLKNQIEPLKPIKENEVSMYVCGPTVYGYVHIHTLILHFPLKVLIILIDYSLS